MQALVLSGGSILGAFQAGAIFQILQKGFAPQAIFGVSAGALNGAFLADRAGQQLYKGKTIDWKVIGQELVEFWITNITGPRVLIEPKIGAGILFDVIFDNFNGLVGTTHLKNVIDREIRPQNLRKCFDAGLIYRAGTVNMINGEIIYADASDSYISNIIDYIYASTAIPISMPIVPISGQPFIDGGACHVAPLSNAIEYGATDIICVVCQSASVASLDPPVDIKNIMNLISRDMDIITNAMVNNDLGTIKKIKSLVSSINAEVLPQALGVYAAAGIPRIIRPDSAIGVDILSFTTADIRNMIEAGKKAAQKQI